MEEMRYIKNWDSYNLYSNAMWKRIVQFSNYYEHCEITCLVKSIQMKNTGDFLLE
jgi:hypothetical protein